MDLSKTEKLQICTHREHSSPIRAFDSDRPLIQDLQKRLARELDLVSVSQAQVIRHLLAIKGELEVRGE
jgi:hypothetical protein